MILLIISYGRQGGDCHLRRVHLGVGADGLTSGPNLGGGRPGAHFAWWVIWWVTGLAHIKDYGIQSASKLAVMHYYEYYQYDYSFLTVNSNFKHKLSKSKSKT